jgi:hypothetical protein
MILIPGKREIMGLLLNKHELKGQAKLIQGGMQKHVQNPKHLLTAFHNFELNNDNTQDTSANFLHTPNLRITRTIFRLILTQDGKMTGNRRRTYE